MRLTASDSGANACAEVGCGGTVSAARRHRRRDAARPERSWLSLASPRRRGRRGITPPFRQVRRQDPRARLRRARRSASRNPGCRFSGAIPHTGGPDERRRLIQARGPANQIHSTVQQCSTAVLGEWRLQTRHQNRLSGAGSRGSSRGGHHHRGCPSTE